ncbi:ABC transporter permease [Oceanidesulfovibrio indonesiensis]|uniref:ABC transporter permease n=1 Tax=Oceanidesulfovibrio indonesiensis TaxID=54767 RepID=A0A7M3MET1_9BACT|nr:ABC transporter permease [Oceanidesulfovibrio indonesiensis]TVM17321.1 ABC transporter permease [Oceanidesulfovibrio indonesiensis]
MLQTSDLLRISFRQVVRQHKRYLGVLLSIALGTAGFIIILTMGEEVKSNLNRDLDLLGGATIIKAFFEEGVTDASRMTRPEWFHDRTVDAVSQIPGVNGTTLLTLAAGKTSQGNREVELPMFGVDENFWDVMGITATQGELFGKEAQEKRHRVVVLGELAAQRVFDRIDVVGERVMLNMALYHVVGTLDPGNQIDRARWAYVPLDTLRARMFNLLPRRLYVRCNTWDDVPLVAAALPEVIKSQQKADTLTVEVAWEPLKHIKRIVWWVEMFVYFSIVATLGLGGFGIWNGMMTAVKSRTREIGLKKAMGAEDWDIMVQFLSESICLSLTAGILGVGLGYGGVQVAANILNTSPPLDLFYAYAGASIAFALVLGIGAGFYPSLSASRMDVVAAIRYE